MELQHHNFFESEIAATSENDLHIARIISDKIQTLLGDELQKVILFGSRARGDCRDNSDYDFVVVANFKEPSWIERAKTIRKFVNATRELDVDVEYIPVTEWELDNKVLFRKAIKKDGVTLYER